MLVEGTEGSIPRGLWIVLDPDVIITVGKSGPIIVRKWGCKSGLETDSDSHGRNAGG